MKRSFPFYRQLDSMDCGPTCLRMIASWYGKNFSLQSLRDKSYISREGVSLLGTSDAAESIGFRSIGVKIAFHKLATEAPLPCIVHWKQKHFVVVYKIDKKKVWVADPAFGKIQYSKEEFIQNWASSGSEEMPTGVCLLLEPGPDFFGQNDEKKNKTSLWYLFSYLRPYRKLILQLMLGMLMGSILQLIFPFLTQAIVDIGINNQNLAFITLILIAQLVLIIGQTSVEFIRGWILLHISTRVNISLISDFLIKMMKLPLSFFDKKMTGDILQRIGDHKRIESFLTGSSLSILFALFNLVIFAIVLTIYSYKLLIIFLAGSLLYVFWVLLFMKKRRELDYKRFSRLAENQSSIIQLISGMHEIKLGNAEKQKRWDWEKIQIDIFRINIKGLGLNQYQQAGGIFFNQAKNILITYIAAKSVVEGSMTLGMMVAVQFIIGQMNSPIENLIQFFRTAQDAKISLERLGEVHLKDDEEPQDKDFARILPESQSLTCNNISFQYEGPHSEFVLKNINLKIGHKETTAIVGPSGSGKTSLIKLLLSFYQAVEGDIRIGDIKLSNFSSSMWRSKCGVVMQDGFIFSDSIAANIALGNENIDEKKLVNSVKTANIQEFIEGLPLGYNTRIGQEGIGLSQGQKQRILIARAIYKDPSFFFFDEATNALDANNEKIIMKNLETVFKGKTVVIVAHRLSTVVNADQIIVLEKGRIIEKGKHTDLIEKKGAYYKLIKNQLELGN